MEYSHMNNNAIKISVPKTIFGGMYSKEKLNMTQENMVTKLMRAKHFCSSDVINRWQLCFFLPIITRVDLLQELVKLA